MIDKSKEKEIDRPKNKPFSMLIKYALIVHYYGLIVNNIVHFFLSFFLTGGREEYTRRRLKCRKQLTAERKSKHISVPTISPLHR
nr:MAG TPA: hypothetical protein [Caudoviricetes sp.]